MSYITYVIIYVTSYVTHHIRQISKVNRFKGYRVLTPQNCHPIDLLRRPYNSVRTAVRHCERVRPPYVRNSRYAGSRSDQLVLSGSLSE